MVTDQTSPVQHQPQAARLTRKKGKKLAEVIAHLHLASVLVLLLAFFILKGNSESVATLTIKKKIADLAAIQASCNRLKYAQTIQGDVRLFDRVASGIGVQLPANHFPSTSHPTLEGLKILAQGIALGSVVRRSQTHTSLPCHGSPSQNPTVSLQAPVARRGVSASHAAP